MGKRAFTKIAEGLREAIAIARGERLPARVFVPWEYHYTESGLDNVFLVNGYRRRKTPYGPAVSIKDVDGLHRAIGKRLVAQPLNGAAVRFLRTEMGMTPRDLAAILGVTEQSVSLWERQRGKELPGPADRLVRALYSEYAGGDGRLRDMLDRIETAKLRFRETNHGWRPCAA